MENQKLTPATLKMIQDLQDDLNRMLEMNSNIEVLWEMERLQNERAFQKSADFIRKSMAKSDEIVW